MHTSRLRRPAFVLAVLLLGGALAFWLLQPKPASAPAPKVASTSAARTAEASTALRPSPAAAGLPEAQAARPSLAPLSRDTLVPVPAPAHPPAPEPARAKVTLQGRDLDLTADRSGEFPRVYMAPGEHAEVTLTLPAAHPGEHVTMAMVDLGGFGSAGRVQTLSLGTDLTLRFPVQVDTNPGFYRAVLSRPGGDLLLPFWVGPDPVLKQLPATPANPRT